MAAWSGLFNGVYGINYPGVRASKAILQKLGIRLHGKAGRKEGAIIRQLIAGDVGGTATKTQGRLRYLNNDDLAGKRVVVAETLVNRATTAADQALLADKLVSNPRPSSYPTEKSGNSGGSKLGY